MGRKTSGAPSILSLWGRNMPRLLVNGRGHLYQSAGTVRPLPALRPPWNSKILWGGKKPDPAISFLPFSLKSPLPPPQSQAMAKGLAAGEWVFWRGRPAMPRQGEKEAGKSPGHPHFPSSVPEGCFWRALLCGGPVRFAGGWQRGTRQGTRTQAAWPWRGPGCPPGWGLGQSWRSTSDY